MKSLTQIASGGELSRINLAIQVATAGKFPKPTLVFDEVDVGIGGRTATKVGKMLSNLAKQTQLLIITHQAQVAGQASWQMHVSKINNEREAKSITKILSKHERIQEISRMIGGYEINETTARAAEELLNLNQS